MNKQTKLNLQSIQTMNQQFDPDRQISLAEALQHVFGKKLVILPERDKPGQLVLKNPEDAAYIGDTIEQQRVRLERATPLNRDGLNEASTIESEDMWKAAQTYLTHKLLPEMTSKRNIEFLARIGAMSMMEFNSLDIPTRAVILSFIDVADEELPKREYLRRTLDEVFTKSDSQNWERELEEGISLRKAITERPFGINEEAISLTIAAESFSRFRDKPNIVEAARWVIGRIHLNVIPAGDLLLRARFFAVMGWLYDLNESMRRR